jgi:hypothetical protein
MSPADFTLSAHCLASVTLFDAVTLNGFFDNKYW